MYKTLDMKNRLWAVALLAIGLALAWASSPLQAKVEQKPVYICGYAINFTDSTVFLTEVQCIDTAYVESKNGFLMDRNQYSSQLNHYMKKHSGGKNYTCMVLFDRKQSRLQKRVEKIRKRNGKDYGTHLKTLSTAEFQFIGEQYVDPNMTMLDEETDGADATEAPAATETSKPKGGKAAKAGKGGRR